jgi:hypothetical protein
MIGVRMLAIYSLPLGEVTYFDLLAAGSDRAALSNFTCAR